MKYLDKIEFDERTYCEETDEYTYYFTAPAEEILTMFLGKYDKDEVAGTEISIEIPKSNEKGDLTDVLVSISPTREVDGDGFEDYDWTDICIPEDQVLWLLDLAEKSQSKKTAFEVHISEVFGRTVVIYAEDRDEAYDKAEELCNAGIIDLNGNDFGSRTVEVIGKPAPEDIDDYEQYGKDDE